MNHVSTVQIHRNRSTFGCTAKQPPTGASASAQAAVLLPTGVSPSLFLKKPPVLSALRGPKKYLSQLAEFKQQRSEKHYQRLLNALREDVPDPRTIKREFKKLCAGRSGSAISYARPVPESHADRQAAANDCLTLRDGIDKVLGGLPEKSPTTSYLKHLKVQLGNQVARFAAVDDLAARTDQTRARMREDLERNRGQAAKMSDEGGEGAIFLGTQLRRETIALASGRPSPRQHDDPASNAGDQPSESVVEAHSSASEHLETSANVPPSPRQDDSRPQGFIGAQPKRQAAEYRTVFKSVEDPGAVKGAMRVHDTVDHVQRCAGEALPFNVGCHMVVEPDAQLRSQLSQQLSRTKTHKDRQTHLERQRAALQEKPVLLQEFLPGTAVHALPFEARKDMVSHPLTCRRTGASLVLGPLLGLNDHLAVNGMGFNNWTNIMSSPDGKQLDMIDLMPQTKDIAKDAKTSLKRLVKDLKELARHVGPDGTLPKDWFSSHMDSSISDFWSATYTPDHDLFSIQDFLSPDERQRQQQLRKELTELPEDAQMERQGLKEAILGIDDAAHHRAMGELRPLRQQAAPHVLAGLIDGIKWVGRNAPALLSAHTVAAHGQGVPPALNAKDIAEIQRILAKLTPSERRKLSSLKPPLPDQASLLKA